MESRSHQDGHRQFEDMAVSHVMGGLTAADGRVFRSHLLECRLCREKVGELRAIAHQLEDVERHERRLTAAKRTETKRREAEDLDPGDDEAPRRLSRRTAGLLATFVVVLTLLAGWNFMLRAQVNDLQRLSDDRLEASVALQSADEEWAVTSTSGSVTGQVREHEGDIVLVAEGLSDRPYGLYLLDTEGIAQYRQALVPDDGRVFPLIADEDVPDDAVRLVIVRTETLTADPEGTTVFQAVDESPG